VAIKAHLEVLAKGIASWNKWRSRNPTINPNLSYERLPLENLNNINLQNANLQGVTASRISLRGANLSGASLIDTVVTDSDLTDANLSRAFLHKTDFSRCTLRRADLSSVYGYRVKFDDSILSGARLSDANLEWSDLTGVSLPRANLSRCNLTCVRMIGTDLRRAVLSGSTVYGISLWSAKLEGAQQRNLLISQRGDPAITVDDIELAHFLYQVLKYDKVRWFLDTITSKAVLLLGRFTPRRKKVLDQIRDRLREEGYTPVVFDFLGPEDRDVTETITTLARMSRFVVADLTDPASIPKELEAIAPRVPVPIQPLIQGTQRAYSMFKDYWKYPWVLELKRYQNEKALMADFAATVTKQAEVKAAALASKRGLGRNR
jgi:hypothetical protein